MQQCLYFVIYYIIDIFSNNSTYNILKKHNNVNPRLTKLQSENFFLIQFDF